MRSMTGESTATGPEPGPVFDRVRTRVDLAHVGFAALAVLASSLILWLGRGLTFFSDEWAVMTRPTGSLADWLAPHNEHWVTVPALAFRALLEVVGLRSYMPYLAVLVAVHVLAAAALYVLVRRTNGPATGLIASAIFLFLGSGFENLYWGFQTSFVGATSAGLWALYAFERGGRSWSVLGTALLVVGLMCSGVGLWFLAAVGGLLMTVAIQRRSIRPLGWLVLPAGAYLSWYFAFGRAGIAYRRDPFTLTALADVPRSVAEGFSAVGGSLLGTGPGLGPLVVLAVVALAAWRLAHGWRPSPRFVAAIAGLLAEYAIIGLVRAGLFDGAVEYSRYTYEGAALGILAGSALLTGIRFEPASRYRRYALVGAAVVVELSFLWNIRLLVDGRAIFASRAEATRAIVELSLNPPPGLDPSKSTVDSPTPALVPGLVARYGSPLTDIFAGDAVQPPSPAALAAAEARLSATGASAAP